MRVEKEFMIANFQPEIRFALTLTLSPRRGKHQWARRKNSRTGDRSPTLEMILPLSAGEGRRDCPVFSIETCPVAIVPPNDSWPAGQIRVTVGETSADGFGFATLNLIARIGLLSGMSAPGQRQVGDEAVVIERVGDDGTGRSALVFKPCGPAVGHAVGVYARRRRHHQKAGF